MKVTTLFGHNSSGGIMNSSGGGTDKGNKGHVNIESHHQSGFVPVKPSPIPTGGGNLILGAPPAVERASSEVLYSSITPSSNGNGFARCRRSLAEPPGGPPAIMGSGGINTGSTSTLTSNGHHNYSNSYTINGNHHHHNSIIVNGSNVNNNGGGNDGSDQQQQNIYEDIDQYQQREPPPMIAPISGVPNLKGKAVIRPIAFRPIPGGGGLHGTHSGASTPTAASGPPCSFRPPSNGPPPLPSGHPLPGNQPNIINSGISGQGGSASLGYYIGGNTSRNGLVPSPATSTTSSQHLPIGSYKNGHGPVTNGPLQNGPPINGKINNGGFAPGHPLATNDGRRHYGSNQELHVVHQSAPPPVFNKFNSLDRRALSRRHHQQAVGGTSHSGNHSMGLLKLAPHSTTMLNGGSESLPPVSTTNPSIGGSQRSLHPSLSSSTNNVAAFNPIRTTMNGQYANTTPQPNTSANVVNGTTPGVISTNGGVSNSKLIKEPERRHSSYDPASRGGGSHYATPTVATNGEGSSSSNHHSSRNSETGTPSNSSTVSSSRLRLSNSSTSSNNKNTSNGGTNSTLPKTSLTAQRSNPINTNGLPDPFGGSTSITSVARKIQNINNNQTPSSANHHPHGSTSLYSSQESLSKNPMVTQAVPPSSTSVNINSKGGVANTTGNRHTAGTPEFQNLSGAIRGAPSIMGSNRVTTTHYFNQQPTGTTSINTSSTSPYVSIIPRSMSGNNLNSLDSTISTTTNPSNSSGHNPTSVTANGGRNHTSGSSSGCSSSSAASQHSNGSGGDPSVLNQTPSPSDSAVGDLESVLREKDTEINYLRETMEQNEQVIFKVYEEKEKMWERELRKIKGLYDNRLRASQQKSSKMEQALTNQTYQLQTDRRKLESELEEIRRQKENQVEQKETLETQLLELRSKLNATSNADNNSTDQNSVSAEETDSSLSLHAPGSTSSKFILSQSKKPSGATIGKSNDIPDTTDEGNDNNTDSNIATNESALELTLQLKEMRMELERRESEVEDLHMNKKSLAQEVSKLKSLLDVAAASTTVVASSGKKNSSNLNDEDEDDMDVSFIREEIATQKEIIISRDQTIEKLQRELQCVKLTINQLKDDAEATKECFEAEKTHWIDEKEKVIRYQKQLQLNYVQMYKRNKTLEAETEALNKNFVECEKQLEATQQKLKEKEQKERERPGSSSSTTSGGAGSKGAAAAQSMIRKTGNSVRARLLKMSLHSESQC